MTDDERSELLPRGAERKLDNRVRWARFCLGRAGLIETTGRARFRITQRGLDLLAEKLKAITRQMLQQYPEFAAVDKGATEQATPTGATGAEPEETPEEALERHYETLRAGLAAELLDRVAGCPPAFFERLVVELLLAMGYGGSRSDAGAAIGRTGDGGIDGVIKEDGLGLEAVYVQAKRWEGTVGLQVVQSRAGALDGNHARKGVLITTSRFSKDAIEYAGTIAKKIVLIDGEYPARLMVDYGVGVAERARYVVMDVDGDYFDEA